MDILETPLARAKLLQDFEFEFIRRSIDYNKNVRILAFLIQIKIQIQTRMLIRTSMLI